MKEEQREHIKYHIDRVQEVLEYKIDDMLARYTHGTYTEQEMWWNYMQDVIKGGIKAICKIHETILVPDENQYNVNEFLETMVNTIDHELSDKYEIINNHYEKEIKDEK